MEITKEEKIDMNLSLLNTLIVQVYVTTSLEERKRKLQMIQHVSNQTLIMLEAL